MSRKRLTSRRRRPRRPRRQPWLIRLVAGAIRWASRRLRARPDVRARPEPGPAVAAFLAGQSLRQVAYLVPDPAIIDPAVDWPGAVADAHGVVRDYIAELTALL